MGGEDVWSGAAVGTWVATTGVDVGVGAGEADAGVVGAAVGSGAIPSLHSLNTTRATQPKLQAMDPKRNNTPKINTIWMIVFDFINSHSPFQKSSRSYALAASQAGPCHYRAWLERQENREEDGHRNRQP